MDNLTKKKPSISAVVCTYNRSTLLQKCLESLVNQTVSKSNYEVIIVDNNSSDNTQEVATFFTTKFKNISLVRENKQGKSYALNTGISVSQGQYIAFVDDDAQAQPDWLEKILDAFDTIDPKPVSVGGEIYPWYEHPPPGWFTDDLEIRSWGSQKCFLKPPRAQHGFSGSNIAFRKDVLLEYGGFPVDYGPKGEVFALGEETALSNQIYKDYPFFWYDPAILVFHFVPAGKMKLVYLFKRSILGGKAMTKINGKQFLPFSYYLRDSALVFVFIIVSVIKIIISQDVYIRVKKFMHIGYRIGELFRW